MAKGIKRKIDKVSERVLSRVSEHAQEGGIYIGVISEESYNMGYFHAIYDVTLALKGIRPNTKGWWDE